MSSATSGFGTLLQQGNAASPEVFTTVAEVLNIDGPGLTMETIDVTNHDSASAHREHIASLKDGGEVTFSINYLPANATHANTGTGLLATYVNRTARNWKIVWTDSGTTEQPFTGFITNFQPHGPIDAQLTADITIKISAAVTPA
jgi:predicted secreted protein